MLSILLTAGSDTNNLASFIERQNAIKIDRKFDSLAQSDNILKKDMINVDKLVYVLKEGMEYRADMGCLQRNLKTNDFFTVREILFVCCDAYDNSDALRFFNEVMQSTNFERYKVLEVKELSFAEIYSSIIGIKDANRFVPNKKKNIYRKERNNISEHAYVEDDEVLDPEEMFNLMEPQSIEEITNNLTLKGIIKQGDNGLYIEDNHEDVGVQLNNVVLPRIEIMPPKHKDVVVITGERKSGVSTLSHLLINSSLDGEINSVLLDATDTNDSEFIASSLYDYVNIINFKDVIKYSTLNTILGCNIISLKGKESISKFDRLRFVLNNSHKFTTQVMFVECRLEAVRDIINIAGDRLHTVVYCSNCEVRDLEHLADSIVPLINVQTLVMLANNINKSQDENSNNHTMFHNTNLAGTDIRSIFDKRHIDCKILRVPRVKTIENNYSLYETVINLRG